MSSESSSLIAAVLTPPAPGAIAVIALTGDGLDAALAGMLRSLSDERPPALDDRRPTLCRAVDGDETLDEIIAVRYSRGGRNAAELHCHGGVRIVQRMLGRLERSGARPASATELLEALQPGAAIERDADQALLTAGSRRLTTFLLAQRMLLPGFLARWGTISGDEKDAYHRRSEAAIRLLRGLRVALVGPPNAGKSTLANRFVGHERSIVSDSAGTTRDWVSETALIDGWPVALIDTAGIRPTPCALETESIRRGREQSRRADCTLAIVDGTQPLRSSVEAMREHLPADTDVILVLNKRDLAAGLTPDDLRDFHASADGRAFPNVCRVSAKTGEGMTELDSALARALRLDRLDAAAPTGFLPGHLNPTE